MKQTMQQTAVQRALQTPRPMPSGLEQFDTADTDENLQRQIDEHEELLEEGRRVKQRREDYLRGVLETPEPDQIADMISLGSSAAASSGYTRESVRARTQAYEDQTSHNLRGTPAVAARTSTDSTASGPTSSSAAAAASGPSSSSAAAAATTALGTAAIPPSSSQSSASAATTITAKPQDIYVLLEEAKERRRLWNRDDDFEKVQLSMEISDLIFQINKLTTRGDYRRPAVGAAYVKAKRRLLAIMEMPL